MSYYWLVFRIISFTYHNLPKITTAYFTLQATACNLNYSKCLIFRQAFRVFFPPNRTSSVVPYSGGRVAHYFLIGCSWVQFVISLSLSSNILGWYLWIGQDRLLPRNFQFIFVLSYHTVQPKLLTVSLNKHRHKQLFYIRLAILLFLARGVVIAEMECQWIISAGYQIRFNTPADWMGRQPTVLTSTLGSIRSRCWQVTWCHWVGHERVLLANENVLQQAWCGDEVLLWYNAVLNFCCRCSICIAISSVSLS